ncbi:MAG TPA: YnfA family protein [Chlorobiota bacterium]|nr:YnfA family protein [Chlorobiota bacterium]
MTSLSIPLFVLAGLCEIGGGYLVWLWLKEGKSPLLGVLGVIILAGYGVVATWQPAGFGRTYATYGGVFVIMSILWGWWVDGLRPDVYDVVGSVIVLVGVAIIFFTPRVS